MAPHILETVLRIFYNNGRALVELVICYSALVLGVPVLYLAARGVQTPIYQLANKST